MVSPTSHACADDALWRGVCDRHGVPCAPQEQARRALGRHIRTRCCECAEPTKYAHELLRRRLCERCERANPQAYGLVTRAQLEHERGAVSVLSSQARKDLLRGLPSIKRGGYDWWLRSAVHDAAGKMAGEMWFRGDASPYAPATEGAEGGEEEVEEEVAREERRARSPARPRRGDSDAQQRRGHRHRPKLKSSWCGGGLGDHERSLLEDECACGNVLCRHEPAADGSVASDAPERLVERLQQLLRNCDVELQIAAANVCGAEERGRHRRRFGERARLSARTHASRARGSGIRPPAATLSAPGIAVKSTQWRHSVPSPGHQKFGGLRCPHPVAPS